ncbi:MAG: hypothetical protein KDC46_09140 [Thermoleophilia bacterium]|nr:hypothetical protein [Thermoleophilia bacterium]
MKPVNLVPADAPVVVASAGKPNMGMIGGAIAGVVAVVAVAGYFAMARVDSVKSEADAANAAATAATTEAASTRAAVQSLGQPIVDSDKQLAQGAEQVVVAAYTERYDYVLLAQELRGIMEGTNGWYESVTASSSPGDNESGKGVEITGYMPTKELAASFNERMNGTRSLDDATVASLESVKLASVKTRRTATYWKFTINANLIDTKAPYAAGADGGSAGDGTTVGDGGDDGSSLTLSLEPKPKPKASKPAEPAKPRNPFDVAATAARGGAK